MQINKKNGNDEQDQSSVGILRHEDKYLIPRNYCDILIKKLQPFAKIDEEAAKHGGSYRVTSLYFDNYMHCCYESNESGYDPRRKWRIRVYNSSYDYIKLERKDKIRGLTSKATCNLNPEQYNQIKQENRISDYNHPLINQFIIQRQSSLLQPIVVVDYERIPFVFWGDDVRLTIDFNIKSKPSNSFFTSQSVSNFLILPKGIVLFEVKYNNRLPSHIQHLINLQGIERTSFSKYCYCLQAQKGGLL